jgi:crotonobetainyl-CoA:carnitine CoA-transferase CaiB-like acyl-CoA transferase
MVAPLAGIKVLEVASWLAAPSCAALMADMGAEVIKVEPPEGDTYRNLYTALLGDDFVHPCYQFDNRGKRGICINLEDSSGRDALSKLISQCDVFITNLTQPRLERYRLLASDIHALSPTAIYAVLSGFGTEGADSDRQAFDQTAFWARSGAMSVFGDRDDGPLISRGGYGDRITGLNLLSAILAALRIKDQTGEGQRVEVTLQRTGVWAMASDVTNALFERAQPIKTSHREPANPIWNFYKTKDGRYLALIMPMALPYWGKFCTMMNRADWATDDRFATLPGMAEHGPSIVPDIEAAFASEDLSVWREKLDASGLIWEPVSELPEVVEDPALRERGAFSVVVHERGGAMEIVSAPFDIRDADIEVRGPAPDRGEHTRVVFREAGMSDEDIETLLARGAIV